MGSEHISLGGLAPSSGDVATGHGSSVRTPRCRSTSGPVRFGHISRSECGTLDPTVTTCRRQPPHPPPPPRRHRSDVMLLTPVS